MLMSSKEKVLNNLEQKNNDEVVWIHENYTPLLKTAKKCSAEDVIYSKAQDDFSRDTLTHPRVSHGLVAGIFSKMNQKPENAGNYAKLLGKYLLPLCAIDSPKHLTPCEIGASQQVFCPDAEDYFVDAIYQVNTNTYYGQPRLSVYHNESGVPIALRKSTQESSALLLQDTNMDNLYIPKGTYIDIFKDDRVTLSGHKTVSDGNDTWQLESYCIENGFTIAPGRLSPWAYSSAIDRKLFGVQKYRNVTIYDSARAKQCSEYNLSSFRKVSKKILQQIGI